MAECVEMTLKNKESFTMKKLLSFVTVLVLAGSAIFANVEIRLNYFGIPEQALNLQDRKESDVKMKSSVSSSSGYETGFNFFFGKNASFFDAGLGLDFGAATIKALKITTDGNTLEENGMSGVNVYMNIGPTFRFTFGNIHSFVIAPSIGLDIVSLSKNTSGVKIEYISAIPVLNFNLGYRLWFLNKTGFHMGLSTAFDLGFALGGYAGSSFTVKGYDTKETSYFSVNSGITTRLSLGLVFNFGDRGVDR